MAQENLRNWLKQPEGWDAVNQPAATPDEQHAQTKALLAEFETAKLYFEVMAMSPRGPELLTHLERLLFFTPIYAIQGAVAHEEMVSHNFPLSPEQWCWVRVGQNSVLHHIRAMLVKATDGPPGIEEREHADEKGN